MGNVISSSRELAASFDAKLNDEILAAHERDDRNALVELYRQAADREESRADLDGMCFFLTYAWIFALEMDHDLQEELCARLRAHGRVDE
ncbi:MAG: hypothetical protein GKR98_17120 [Boseongicola sp.]|nr:MAG: hypothetical protein GKR98_17120 [Boseongicola sp.]